MRSERRSVLSYDFVGSLADVAEPDKEETLVIEGTATEAGE